jgi:PiT family inorganic phosphate transporter
MALGFTAILILAIVYGYINGVNSSATVVSTIISSRAMSPRFALILAACCIFIGPFLFGSAIANTIASDFIAEDAASVSVVIAGLSGAILWCLVALWLRIPTSISHALFGGLIGAAWFAFGFDAIQMKGLYKVLAALFLSPILGLFGALWLVRLLYFLGQWASPRINIWLNRGQILAAMLMALSFGANNGQIIIATIALGLIASGMTTSFSVPSWLILLSAAISGLGTLTGGVRLIQTLSGKFYKIRPIHGLGAQLASALIIWMAASLGGPVSGSQVLTSSILGAGSADRIQKVRWGLAKNILLGWFLTLPFSALFAVLVCLVIERIQPLS